MKSQNLGQFKNLPKLRTQIHNQQVLLDLYDIQFHLFLCYATLTPLRKVGSEFWSPLELVIEDFESFRIYSIFNQAVILKKHFLVPFQLRARLNCLQKFRHFMKQIHRFITNSRLDWGAFIDFHLNYFYSKAFSYKIDAAI